MIFCVLLDVLYIFDMNIFDSRVISSTTPSASILIHLLLNLFTFTVFFSVVWCSSPPNSIGNFIYKSIPLVFLLIFELNFYQESRKQTLWSPCQIFFRGIFLSAHNFICHHTNTCKWLLCLLHEAYSSVYLKIKRRCPTNYARNFLRLYAYSQQ